MSAITKERIKLFIKNPLDNGLTRGEQMELARIALASLEAKPIGAFHIAEQQVDGTSDYIKDGEWPIDNGIIEVYAAPPVPVVPEEKPMPNALSMLEREITQLIGDAQEATVTGYELIAEAWRLMDGQDPKTSDWHSKASKYLNSNIVEKVDDDRIEAVKAVLRRLAGNYPVTPGRLPGGFTIEDAKELHENLVRSHISQALSGEKMKKKDRDADLRWIHGVIVQAAWFVKASLEQTALSGTPPVTTDSWISCSERMPVIGELNWRTSFPLLVTCEIGVIPAYYGFVSVNGDRHYGFMESLKYGDDNGNHPQTNEYGLISNVTHWMPLPERRRSRTVNNAELFQKISALATECHAIASELDVGDERTEMFEIYSVLRNLCRRGYATQVGRMTNPLLSFCDEDDSDEDDE